MEWSRLAQHLTGYAHIATVSPDGRPHVAKVAPAIEGEVVWMAMNADSTTVRNLRANPELAVMFEPEAEVYLYGTVELIADHATKRRIADAGLFPFAVESFFGSPEHDSWVLLRLAPARASLISQGETGLRRDTWRGAPR
jgi:general stress protein 26